MASLLVTGGAGFIGANFVHYWTRHYPEDRVVVLDALTYAGNLASLKDLLELPNLRFVHGDIRDQELVQGLLHDERLDTIVHFAAESHVDRSILGPEAFVETNITGTYRLLEAARLAWLTGNNQTHAHRFHHVSTDEVYGSLGPDDQPFTETTPYSPSSPYAASKAASDHLVSAYAHTFGLQTTISNCSNNYGPFQFPEKLIPLMIVNILSGKPLPIYGDGSNIRDWLHVDDHVRAIDAVLKKGQPGRTYNIGGNEEHANHEIVARICELVDQAFADDASLGERFPDAPAVSGAGATALITYVEDRPGHDWRYAIDAHRIEAELGFEPSRDFEAGIRETIGWMLDNEEWWRAVQDDSYRDWIRLQYD